MLEKIVLDVIKSLCSTLVAYLVPTAVGDVRRGRTPWRMSFIFDKLIELLNFVVSFVKTMFSVSLRSSAYLFSLRSCRMCVSVFSYVEDLEEELYFNFLKGLVYLMLCIVESCDCSTMEGFS